MSQTLQRAAEALKNFKRDPEYSGATLYDDLHGEEIDWDDLTRCITREILGGEEVQGLLFTANELFEATRPSYHDCLDNGESECHFCLTEKVLAALQKLIDSVKG